MVGRPDGRASRNRLGGSTPSGALSAPNGGGLSTYRPPARIGQIAGHALAAIAAEEWSRLHVAAQLSDVLHDRFCRGHRVPAAIAGLWRARLASGRVLRT